MSIKYALSRFAKAVAVTAVGAVGSSQVLTGNSKNPPGKLPILAEEVPARKVQLDALRGSSPASPFDVLVIGGGATGSGIALDAVTRGLRVALVEKEDFGAGTSSRSTKLVHGGVRYLEKAVFNFDYEQLRLVFHALQERAQILKNAPHLATPLPIMTPCYSWWELPYYWLGLKAYDIVAGRNNIHLSRFVTAKEALQSFPTLARTKSDGRALWGTVVYFDGQMDDARLNVAVACTAAQAGAAVLNHAEVTKLGYDDLTGRVGSARVRDLITGKEMDVHAKVVINATGPYCDGIRKMLDPKCEPLITPSSGVHVVLPDYFSPKDMGLIVPKTKDGRVMFLLPWEGRTLAGTTDASTTITKWPQPQAEEIQTILDTLTEYLSIQVKPSDVLSTWSGIRPLAVEEAAKDTASVHRDHIIKVGEDGLVTITGGKWTTYRNMAEEVVDVAVKLGGLRPTSRCLTEHINLMGTEGYHPTLFATISQQFVRMKRAPSGKVTPAPMDLETAHHLAHEYGGHAAKVALIAQNENLGERLSPDYPVLEAEVAYSARHEYCLSACDFLARRSRLAFLDAKASREALPRVIELLAAEHHWDRKRCARETQEALQFLDTFRIHESIKPMIISSPTR